MANEDLWSTLNAMKVDLAEIKGMMKVHMENENIHHNTPCEHLTAVNKNICTIVGAVVLALLSGLGAMVLELLKR